MSFIQRDHLISRPEMTISLCIPCIPKHIRFLNACLSSVQHQSRLPEEIIIFISGISLQRECELQHFFTLTFPSLNIRLGSVPDQQYAGTNRNSAAFLATATIVSFMDADDTLHPHRIEYIHKIFSTFRLKGLLHHYIQNKEFSTHSLHSSLFVQLKFTYEFSDDIQHGHPSVLREVFDVIQYNERPRQQDVDFILEFARLFPQCLFVLCTPLSRYYPEFSTLEIQ